MRVTVGVLRALLLLPILASSCVSNATHTGTNATPTAAPSAYDFSAGRADTPPGIYPDAAPPPNGCCFVGPSATIPITLTPKAATLNITFYQPRLLAHPAYEGTMIVSFNGSEPRTIAHLKPGLQTVSLALPKQATANPTLILGLRFPKTFVPMDENMGADTRHLSIVLRKVNFSSESVPNAYDFTVGMLNRIPPGMFDAPSPSECCFVGPITTLRLAPPAKATTLNITFYQPRLLAHPAYEGTMIVSFNGLEPTTIAHLKPGLQTVRLALPKQATARPTLILGLRFPKTFVPKDENMGGDARHLSIILRKVNFSSESLPNTYDFTVGKLNGIPPGMFKGPPAKCCFVGPSTTLRLAPPAKATTLTLWFYQPPLPAHPTRESTMVVTFNGQDPATVSHLKAGSHIISLKLPKQAQRSPILSIELGFPNAFVPKDEGMGADTRHLSIVLRKVTVH